MSANASYCARRRPYINNLQKQCQLLWAKAHLRWKLSGNVCCGLMSQIFRMFSEIMNVAFSGPREDHLVTSVKFKIQRLSWFVRVLVGNTHIFEGIFNAEGYIRILAYAAI